MTLKNDERNLGHINDVYETYSLINTEAAPSTVESNGLGIPPRNAPDCY